MGTISTTLGSNIFTLAKLEFFASGSSGLQIALEKFMNIHPLMCEALISFADGLNRET